MSICYKPVGSCKTCAHYAYDKEEERMCCNATEKDLQKIAISSPRFRKEYLEVIKDFFLEDE